MNDDVRGNEIEDGNENEIQNKNKEDLNNEETLLENLKESENK